MAWYNKYLQVYEKSYDEVAFKDIVSTVRSNLKSLQSDEPLVTVSVIAYNEEKHLLACLWALSEMKVQYPIEIIGVDNESRIEQPKYFVLWICHIIQRHSIVVGMHVYADYLMHEENTMSI